MVKKIVEKIKVIIINFSNKILETFIPEHHEWKLSPTKLGSKLRKCRRKIVKSGQHLLSWAELDKEMKDRQG